MSSTSATNTMSPTPPPTLEKPPVWWIFMPFEFFFSLFPDITPYFSIFYFSIYKYILSFGIAVMIYSYRTNQLSLLSILMIYVGIRQPAWYLFYLYVLLWIGILFLSKMIYETPPWKVDWLPEINEMEKKGDASPDADDEDNPRPRPKKGNLDKIFDDVDSDEEEDSDKDDEKK